MLKVDNIISLWRVTKIHITSQILTCRSKSQMDEIKFGYDCILLMGVERTPICFCFFFLFNLILIIWKGILIASWAPILGPAQWAQLCHSFHSLPFKSNVKLFRMMTWQVFMTWWGSCCSTSPIPH